MSKFLRWVTILFLGFFIYHLIRDILQIFNIRGNIIADLFITSHYWCRPYCDYITIPPEVIGTVLSLVILKRKKFGLLGIVVLACITFIFIGFLLP